jgi:hypothetical protein
MSFEEAEIESTLAPMRKEKRLGVIVLTDNRAARTTDNTALPDFRCSAFKGISRLI